MQFSSVLSKNQTNSLPWERPRITDFMGHRLRVAVQGLAQCFGLLVFYMYILVLLRSKRVALQPVSDTAALLFSVSHSTLSNPKMLHFVAITRLDVALKLKYTICSQGG